MGMNQEIEPGKAAIIIGVVLVIVIALVTYFVMNQTAAPTPVSEGAEGRGRPAQPQNR